jgi:CubicO group peptidase (beta-lactamase class C family)
MMLRKLMPCLLVTACLSTQVQAQTAVDVGTFDATFRGWMTEHSIGKGVLAVAYKGRLVAVRGHGGQDPRERVLLASLSKAITGRCVAALIADNKLRFDSTVGKVLAPFFRQHGEPADARLKEATVEQLLTHRAGFPPAPRDLMAPAAVELLKARTPGKATPAELLAATLTQPLASAPGEAFRYSNIGYLALGVMIETLTGESYERWCARTVLEPAGITRPALDEEWRAFSSFGGWRLNGPEYLAFLANDRDLGTSGALPASGGPPAWQPVRYGLGQLIATIGDAPASRLAWHTASWGVPPATIGMHAAQHEGGAAWFVWFTPRPAKDVSDALLEKFAALPARIEAWPAHDLFPEHGITRKR